ncbi:MAG: RNA polymerase sigma factor RpoH [Gammaproteobacteria bacterium]|nr:RNA polymerase sigma factor RpoH [Gammaproteobacteria bacterium]
MSKALALSPQLSISEQGIDYYMKSIKAIPLLTVEQEAELARRFCNEEDVEAARTLVMSHLRFVLYIAQGYLGYGLPLADLVQEGNVGLMKAVKRFDPTVGVRLVAFAVHWIRAEIHEFILRNWRIVKVASTKAQRKLFFNLRSAKKRLGWLTRLEVENVANDLGVNPKDVLEMEKRLSAHDMAFDASDDDDDEYAEWAPAAYLADYRFEPSAMTEKEEWKQQRHEQLQEAFTLLDARSRDILEKRWLSDEKTTLQTLAEHYRVSAERIRQIEHNAMKKIRKQIMTQ